MLTDQEKLNCFQLMINSYEGRHGPVKRLSDSEYFRRVETNGFKVEYIRSVVGDTVYYCFQGTQDYPDWWKNIQKHSTKFHGLSVHDGFLDLYKIFERKHFRNAKKHLLENRVIFTGHSQGAALATLAAFDYAYYLERNSMYARDSCLLPIASPRVGKGAFEIIMKEFYPDTEIYRFGWDLVTTVPWQIGGYRHVGKIVQLGTKGWRPTMFDHYPEKYIEAFKKTIKASR